LLSQQKYKFQEKQKKSIQIKQMIMFVNDD
jgi:hypothetical protein